MCIRDRAHSMHIRAGGWTEVNQVSHAIVDRACHEDRCFVAVGFDASCQFYRVTPEIVDELASTDQTADDRTGVDTDLRTQTKTSLGTETFEDAHNLARELHHTRSMVGTLHRQPRDRQVGRADGAN